MKKSDELISEEIGEVTMAFSTGRFIVKVSVDKNEEDMIVAIQCLSDDRSLTVSRRCSWWSPNSVDLRDVSIALHHIAGKKDTTEEVPEFARDTSEQLLCQWALLTTLHNCDMALWSRDFHRFQGLRVIDLTVLPDEGGPTEVFVERMMVEPDELRRVAKEMDRIYEAVQDYISANVRDEPGD